MSGEHYAFECAACGAAIRTPDRETVCPVCGVQIAIDWQGKGAQGALFDGGKKEYPD